LKKKGGRFIHWRKVQDRAKRKRRTMLSRHVQVGVGEKKKSDIL